MSRRLTRRRFRLNTRQPKVYSKKINQRLYRTLKQYSYKVQVPYYTVW